MENKEPIIIKKYPNRRLYNTQISNYITLDDLYIMVKKGEQFVVQDVKTGEDLTSTVLTQIILERELKGDNMLPPNVLRQIILFYDDNVQKPFHDYLELSMKSFESSREKFLNMSKNSMPKELSELIPWQSYEELTKQNLQILEQAMKMFGPGPHNK